MEAQRNSGLLIVISSPSGAGKTSICKRLLKENNKIFVSVSDTTRAPRDNEIIITLFLKVNLKERLKITNTLSLQKYLEITMDL